ncbi:MAG: ECF-type sigma factor [Pirellulaceae bacterium]
MSDELSSPIGSVSRLIADMKEGDADALAELHQRYWPQLVNIARSRLKRAPLRYVDEEDVAQSALIGFYNTVQNRRAAHLENREQLLALLSHIVACKAINQIQHAMTLKQGQGQVTSLTPLAYLAADSSPTSSHEALLRDCYTHYVGELPDELRPFAEMHLAGLTNAEIAQQLDCVERTVERKLALLRSRWRKLADVSLES